MVVLIFKKHSNLFHINISSLKKSIEIINTTSNTNASINLKLGASVEKLLLFGKEIIKCPYPVKYEQSYASTIMFPFCGRVENGKYSFKNKNYQLDINDKQNKSALHGNLHNKEFTLIRKVATKNNASVILQYKSDGTEKGFPFKYSVEVTYTLSNEKLTTNVTVQNIENTSFPFAIGWHPYFYSSNLKESTVSFNSSKQAIFNNKMILDDFKTSVINKPFTVGISHFDNCYWLDNSDVFFTTPEYKISLGVDKCNFLQIYTPPENKNTLAIEPISAPSNSFNNKIGLQILESSQQYTINWEVKLIK